MQETPLWQKGLFLAVGVAILNKAMKGNLWTAPIFLFFIIAFPIFLVISFFMALPFVVKAVLGLFLTFFLVKDMIPQVDTALPKEKPHYTREELDKVYFKAMTDLEEGKITDRQFLNVAENVRERKKYLNPSNL